MASKTKTVYVCDNCGQDAPKWLGRCPSCGAWNTMKQISIRETPQSVADGAVSQLSKAERPKPIALTEVNVADLPRCITNDPELDRVMGGGIVPGSLVLIAGEPGIGKSTLLLQTVMNLAGRKVLYVSGEESERQIKLRADRLGDPTADVRLLCETHMEDILVHLKNEKPDLVVVDSIQTMTTERVDSPAGTVTQIREVATLLLKVAKACNLPIFLVGHITKEGVIAGPKVLEHIVDTVLQFEGDRQHVYRILRSIKNRFGSTSELGIYEMLQNGLRPVVNASELLLTTGTEDMSGKAIAATMEGVRPLLIETQALVSSAVYGTPQRSSTGFDLRRLHMLLAVLEKRVGFKLGQKDVFLNIAGGLRVSDPATDLSVIAAILSSNVDTPIPNDVCVAGEVGLNGEIRPVARIAERIAEAAKLGFARILIPEGNLKSITQQPAGIQVVGVNRVEQALRELFG